MIKIFGKKFCSACQEKKAELTAQGIKYEYHDLDTPDCLAEAAFHGLIGRNLSLPIILEIDSEDHAKNPIGHSLQDNQDITPKNPENLKNPVVVPVDDIDPITPDNPNTPEGK